MLDKIPPEWLDIAAAAAMAFTIAALRVVYDNEDTKPVRILLEATICGLTSMAVSSAIIAMKIDIHWAIFAGGVVGYLGSSVVRSMAMRIISSKIDKG